VGMLKPTAFGRFKIRFIQNRLVVRDNKMSINNIYLKHIYLKSILLHFNALALDESRASNEPNMT
jgi:hypothetical protein